MSQPPNTAQWLFKAEEARSLAEVMQDQTAKRIMLRIAAGYRRLAEHAASMAESGLPIDEGKIDVLD